MTNKELWGDILDAFSATSVLRGRTGKEAERLRKTTKTPSQDFRLPDQEWHRDLPNT